MAEQFPVPYTEDLYKGMVWLKGGNQKLFYVGTLLLVTALPLADAQAAWIVKYITGRNPLCPSGKGPRTVYGFSAYFLRLVEMQRSRQLEYIWYQIVSLIIVLKIKEKKCTKNRNTCL